MNENKRPQTQRSPRAQGHPQPAMPLPHQPRPTPLCTATAPDQKNRSKSNSAREEETPPPTRRHEEEQTPREGRDEGRHRSKKLEQAENIEQRREATREDIRSKSRRKAGATAAPRNQTIQQARGPSPTPRPALCFGRARAQTPILNTRGAQNSSKRGRERKPSPTRWAVSPVCPF